MRAMVYRGPYKVRVEEKDVPPIEHPNDAIVRVTLAAICGSDLHLYHGLMPDTRVGTTFGHEFIGVVEEVGSSVQNLKRGDRVMVPFNVFCGSCYFCARGLYSNCHNVNPNATAIGGIYGYSHTCGGYDGGQAEYVRVPFADVGPTVIPEWMDDEDALMLTEDRKSTRLNSSHVRISYAVFCLKKKNPAIQQDGARYSSAASTSTPSLLG